MKYSAIFKERINCYSEDMVFAFLVNNLKETIRSWDFFVAWDKVMGKIGNIEVQLNILNYLIGKENAEEAFKLLIKEYPSIVGVIPVLLAIRDNNVKVLEPHEDDIFNYKEYSFKKKNNYNSEEIDGICEFAKKTGLLSMFQNKNIKSVVDYVIGVEVGLDTNARKNRSGTAMEMITELFIKRICMDKGFTYIRQATQNKIKESFGYDISVDKSDRSFDFAVNNGDKLYLIETNYYGGGGSKLKSVAGEFTTVFKHIKENTPHIGFIWITDGLGWINTNRPLREAFDKVDYIINLSMVESRILEDIISKGL